MTERQKIERRRYSEEFKHDAVELLARPGAKLKEVARGLGIPAVTLRQWRSAHEVWLSDITYIATGQGWLDLAGFLDLATRRLVGWATGSTLEAGLVCQGLRAARQRCRPGVGLIIHSDQGGPYASDAYRQLLGQIRALPSMSRRGNCYDNATMESFWSTLKAECLAGKPPATHQQARQMIFEYIETYYNRVRLHSSLGYLSPVDFEKQIS